jgi:hypothetical protein
MGKKAEVNEIKIMKKFAAGMLRDSKKGTILIGSK